MFYFSAIDMRDPIIIHLSLFPLLLFPARKCMHPTHCFLIGFQESVSREKEAESMFPFSITVHSYFGGKEGIVIQARCAIKIQLNRESSE